MKTDSPMSSTVAWNLWAKTGPEGTWHPLPAHMLDVGAVALELLEHHVSQRLQEQFAKKLGIPVRSAQLLFACLISLHDLGKACPEFIAKWKAGQERAQKLGLTFGSNRKTFGHGTHTALVLAEALKRRGGSSSFSRQAARWVGAHHGVFPDDSKILDADGSEGDGGWHEARESLVALVFDAFTPPQIPTMDETLDDVGLWLTGLTSVADWIGSMSEHFAFLSETKDAKTYLERARLLAAKALREINWNRWHAGDERSFELVFGFPPRPLQSAAIQLTQDCREPLLAVVEAPMGEGKTEAALWLAHEQGRQVGHGGFYVALPTMATANQMFTRVCAFLKETYEGRLGMQLLHGAAGLNEQAIAIRGVVDDGHHSSLHQSECSGTVAAEEWFSRSKRGLLAPFGVGTIDQALLGVLRTRHGAVRMFGLSGKTIILDEVHAYDAYTSRLLDRLVAWLRALGASVVILSATLPRARRQELLTAWGSDPAPESAYPRMTSCLGSKSSVVSIAAGSRRSLCLTQVEGGAEWLADRVRPGGCGVWICNTVVRAQEAFAQFNEMKSDGRLPPDTELHLMHARLLAGDRQERETKLLGVFGKQGTRPSRAIVVGTQVLEQSLDVDFDVMLTDPAPIDLVLQRAGRLWRHDRVRPSHFTTAELGVVQLGGDAELPDFKPHSYVYDESVLLRSWALLAARDSLQLPDDIEPLVQRVYSREDATLSEGQRSRLMTLDRALDAEIEQNERNAEGRLLAPPGGVDDPFSNFGNPLDESDDKVHAALRAVTRLGDPSASVVCLSRSADGVIRLRRSGTQIALGSKPNFSLCRDLLEHAVSISRQGLVQQLQKLPKPSGWQETAFLRNHCALVFDDSRAIVGNTTIIDDPILGIVFEKEATS